MRSPSRPKKPARLALLRLETLETRQLLSGDVLPAGAFLATTGLIARPVGSVTSHSVPVGPAAFGTSFAPLAGQAVSGPYSPAQIRHAYGVDQLSQDGSGQTIAIVDAYDDPTIAADLATFDSQFGLPAANLIKATPGGGTPAYDSGWSTEIALDVEWAHAIAPKATILLVEANSANDSDLFAAVDYAVAHGASQVSMSWGGGEFPGVSGLDSHFAHPGVSFLASAGDSGTAVDYPAVSPYVTGVGGTTISLDAAGNKLSETTWSGSGGGVSVDVARPSYQAGFQPGSGRGVPDVAYDADLGSGVYVRSGGSWYGVGGTSAGAPQWAGLFALANQGRASAGLAPLGTGTTYGTNEILYGLAGGSSYTNAKGAYTDITTGSNGLPATVGYDNATGLGSPVANVLVPDLITYGTTTTSSAPIQINAGAAGFSTTGAWQQWAGFGHAGGLDEEAMPGDGSSKADFTFTGLANTQYSVQVTWPIYSNRATNAPYTIRDGSTSLGTYQVNQQASPVGSTDSTGTTWQQLGIVTDASGTLTVELSNLANGRVEADAVRLVPVPGAAVTPPPPASQPMIINAGGSGFSTTGAWQQWAGFGHAGGLDEEAMPGDGSAKADFAYTGLAPGQYTVAITWPIYSNRATNAPYTIYDGSTSLGSDSINQQASPVGSTDSTGTTWQALSTVTVGADGLLKVELSNLANGRVEADAVMIQQVSSSGVARSAPPVSAPAPTAGVQYPGGVAASGPAAATSSSRSALPQGPRSTLGHAAGGFGRAVTIPRIADGRRADRAIA